MSPPVPPSRIDASAMEGRVPLSSPFLPAMPAMSTMHDLPTLVAPTPQSAQVKPKKPEPARGPPAPRRIKSRTSAKAAWGYLVGNGSAKQVLAARAAAALLVMLVTTIVLIVVSPRSVRIVRKSPDGSTVSRPCIPTAFGIGGLAFGVALGAPYAVEFMRPEKKRAP